MARLPITLLKPALGISHRFRVSGPLERIEHGEKPGLVLSLSDDHLTGDLPGLGLSPGLNFRRQLFGAVVIAVKKDKDAATTPLVDGAADEVAQRSLGDELSAACPDRWMKFETELTADIPQSAEEDGQSLGVAVALHERLDLHPAKR